MKHAQNSQRRTLLLWTIVGFHNSSHGVAIYIPHPSPLPSCHLDTGPRHLCEASLNEGIAFRDQILGQRMICIHAASGVRSQNEMPPREHVANCIEVRRWLFESKSIHLDGIIHEMGRAARAQLPCHTTHLHWMRY